MNTIETQPYTSAFVAAWHWMAVRQNAPPLLARLVQNHSFLTGYCPAAFAMSLRKDCDARRKQRCFRIFSTTPSKTSTLHVEKKILTTAPKKMKEAAQSEELAGLRASKTPRGEARATSIVLNRSFKIIGEKPQAKTCDAMLELSMKAPRLWKL